MIFHLIVNSTFYCTSSCLLQTVKTALSCHSFTTPPNPKLFFWAKCTIFFSRDILSVTLFFFFTKWWLFITFKTWKKLKLVPWPSQKGLGSIPWFRRHKLDCDVDSGTDPCLFVSVMKQMMRSILKVLTPVKSQHLANVQCVSNSKYVFWD